MRGAPRLACLSLDRATAGDPPVAGGRGARAGQPAAGTRRRPRIQLGFSAARGAGRDLANCEVVDLAADLGAKLVLYIAGWQVFGTTRQEAWAHSLDALTRIATHAAGKGVTIVVEPTSADSDLIETADDALELMRATGLTNVRVMFDTYHAIYRNEVPSDYVHTMGRDLGHIHLAGRDHLAPGDPGSGVDWHSVLQAAKDIGFSGHMTWRSGSTRAAPIRTPWRDGLSPTSRAWNGS